jgi:hypothetical protein
MALVISFRQRQPNKQRQIAMPRNSTVTVNFQTDAKMRDDLHAAARSQERSASALIRMAIRAFLDEHPSPPPVQRRREGLPA